MKKPFVKILASAAILAAVFSLSACDDKVKDKTTTAPGTTVAETTAVETATTPDTTTQPDTTATQPSIKTTETITTTLPTTIKPDETPDETPENPAPQLAVGQTVTVSLSATHFGSKSQGVKMAQFVPGTSFTVYQIVDEQVLIGLGGVYTGWVNKSDVDGSAPTTPVKPDEPENPAEPTTKPSVTQPATTRPATTKPDTTKPATTQPDMSIKAPVNGSKSQIVSFYNQYADELRNYTGKVTVQKSDGTVTVINSIGGGALVKNLAQDMLPNDYSAKATLTFVNGKSGDTTLARHLPRGKQSKMSVLQPEGVASATCVPSGNGWRVTIALKTETVNSLSGVPKYTAQCMDTLSLTDDDLNPFTLQSANVTYTNCSIDAVMDSLGRITKLDIETPATITGRLKYGFVGIDADVTGNYKGNYTFAY